MKVEPLRVLIAYDEPLGRERVRSILKSDAGLRVVAEAQDGPRAISLTRRHRPQLALLDVELPGFDAFEVLATLQDQAPPAVVFLSAHGRHAARAFDASVVDYVLKPFTPQRLRQAVERAKAHWARCHGMAPAPDVDESAAAGQRISLRSGRRRLLVSPSEVRYAVSANLHCAVHLRGETIRVRESLATLHGRLPQVDFLRISRFAIVNVAHVESIRPKSNGDQTLVLLDGTTLTVSRSRRAELLARLKPPA